MKMGLRSIIMRRCAAVGSGERDLLRILRENPQLKAKIEAMLAIIENAGGDVEKAAEAERRTIEELHRRKQHGNADPAQRRRKD